MGDQALALHRLERLDRAARSGDLVERPILRIVQEDDAEAVQSQPFEAFLDRAAHPRRAEAAGLRIAIDLRLHDRARGHTAELAQGEPDASLALAAAVPVGGIEIVQRP